MWMLAFISGDFSWLQIIEQHSNWSLFNEEETEGDKRVPSQNPLDQKLSLPRGHFLNYSTNDPVKRSIFDFPEVVHHFDRQSDQEI